MNSNDFRQMLSEANPFFKLPEHNGEYYMTMALNASEKDAKIGDGSEKFLQTWELTNIEDGPNDEAVVIFKMWGSKPDFSPTGFVSNFFSASHEGKEMIVPISSLIPIFIQLTAQSPEIFSIDKYAVAQGLKNIFKNKAHYYEDYPQQIIDELRREIGNTCLIYPEIKGLFPNPPFKSHISRVNRNGEIFNTKMLNGTLKLFRNAIVLDNTREVHYPKWDLGYEPETDFILSIRSLFGSYTLEFMDKSSERKIEFAIEDFQFVGQNS